MKRPPTPEQRRQAARTMRAFAEMLDKKADDRAPMGLELKIDDAIAVAYSERGGSNARLIEVVCNEGNLLKLVQP